MNTVEFLRFVCPRQGIYVIETGPHPVEGAPGRTTHWPRAFESIEAAAAYCMKMCGEFDVFFGVHSFARYHQEKTKSGEVRNKVARTQVNAAYARALYLDLDVQDPKKPHDSEKYADRGEAVAGLVTFAKPLKLPRPMLISSGRGVHVYWPFDSDVASAEWKPAAEMLKRLAAHHGLKADKQVTADPARILRPVGTCNRKDPANPLPVAMLSVGAAPASFPDLMATLTRAAEGLPSSGLLTGARTITGSAGAAAPSETPENVAAVRAMLDAIDPDVGRSDWRKVVWSVASLRWGCGQALAREWSARGVKFDEGAFATMWDGFDPSRPNGITWRTLQHLAIAAGYLGQNLMDGAASTPTIANAGAGSLPSVVDSTSEADIANGERLAASASGRMLWVREPNEWVRFSTEAGYLSMPRDEVEGFAVGVVKAMRREAGALHDADPHSPATKQALQNSRRASARPHMLAMIDMAKAVPGMAVSLAEFDADPMMLGVRNGVLDLRSGRLHPFAPELRVSKRAAVAFDPAAACPMWKAFLARALPDREVRAFLRRWAGYCLTGDVGAHKWVFLFGSGANGKSVFTETLAHLMGDYALPLAAEVLMDDPRGGRNHDPDIMALQGRRLAFATETEEGQRLASARVKRLTGGDTLSGRRPYGKAPESFTPSHKLMVSGNHRPAIPDTSPGTWRRVAIVEFGVEIPERERDASLAAKLLEEGPGILNWALAGLSDFQASGGLRLPPAVTAATDEYQRDEDVFGQFLADRCELGEGPAFRVPEANLYEAFGGWCASIGRKQVPTKTMLTRQIKGRRVTLDRNAKAYTGVRLT